MSLSKLSYPFIKGKLWSDDQNKKTMRLISGNCNLSPSHQGYFRIQNIPAAKLGKEWRFKKSIIDKWFNEFIDEKFRDLY